MKSRVSLILGLWLLSSGCDIPWGGEYDFSYLRTSIGESISQEICVAIHKFKNDGGNVMKLTTYNMYDSLKQYLDTSSNAVYIYSRDTSSADPHGYPGERGRVIGIGGRDLLLHISVDSTKVEFYYDEDQPLPIHQVPLHTCWLNW
jgi:hypothetical protein